MRVVLENASIGSGIHSSVERLGPDGKLVCVPREMNVVKE